MGEHAQWSGSLPVAPPAAAPGYSLYIDDLVITDVTDAKAAQDASDATASAVSGLTARVTDAEGKITARAAADGTGHESG